MKKILMVLFAILMVFGAIGIASADPYTDVNTKSNLFDVYLEADTWLFDLDMDSLDGGVVINSLDTINTASLSISFETLSDANETIWTSWNYEIASLNLDGTIQLIEVDNGITTFADVSAQLVNDHEFALTIRNWGINPFRVNSATLSGDYTAAPVPEPATMLLLGSGLLGLGGLKKRFFKK